MPKPKIKFDPPILDLSLYAGDGPNFQVVIKDPLGVPVPLTGTMEAEIRAEYDDPDPVLASFDIDLALAAQGIAILSLTGDQTQALVTTNEKFEGVWDLEWTAAGSEPLTLCRGKVECFPDVTR
jgi:hypothetical protein